MTALATINTYASQYAGTPTTISCDAPSTFPNGWLGYVNLGPDGRPIPVVHLPAQTCAELEHADTGNAIVPADFLTLAHELTHIRLASTDECLVERTAYRNAWGLIRLFKLAAWRTRAILAGLAYADASTVAAEHPIPSGAC